MEATASSKKPKRTPKNAARSAHGQRIHNALCEPPTPLVPTLSSNNLTVRTRSAARREAAIMAAIPIRSVRAPSALPQDRATNKKENEKKKSVRFALNDVADANTTTTKDKPNPSSDNPTEPSTSASSTTLTPQRPRPLSAPHILNQLLARNPDFGATHARLRLPSVAPRLLLRSLFADARSGKFGEAAKPSLTEEEEDEQKEAGEKATMQEKQEKQQPKKIDKKEMGKLLRKMIARIAHDTRDGRDELANAGYFLQVLEEVERTRGVSKDADAGAGSGAGDEGLLEGVMPWLVGEVFKMLVILVSWHRQLAPREEGEDAGCVLSVRQVLELVEGEIEAAARIVHGAV